MCHHNSFLLYCSIENTSLTKWNKVTHASILLSFLTMILMAFGGYATFTGKVQGDLLNSYCWNDDLMNVSRLLFSITILLTYPIECFVCREVVKNVLGNDSDKWHYLVTVVLVVLTYLLSLITDCLSIVLEINVSFFESDPLKRNILLEHNCKNRSPVFFTFLNFPGLFEKRVS